MWQQFWGQAGRAAPRGFLRRRASQRAAQASAAAPPAMSMRLSYREAVREGTKLWWYSSESATQATKAKEASHHLRLSPRRGEAPNARAASSARTAYSVKWAAFRTRKWTSLIAASLMPGESHSSTGRMMRDVFAAEKLEVEAKKMKQTHATTGP